jgi:peptide/nickel transport system permease protein
MLKFIVKRIGQALIVLVGVTLITFILVNVIPGNPVVVMLGKRADETTITRVTHEMGLDKPLPEQYGKFLINIVRGDLGKSYIDKRPVIDMIGQGFKVTITIGLYALIFSVLLGTLIGVLAAVFRGRILDRVLMVIATIGVSAPVFWIALMLQIVFGLVLHWLPISGVKDVGWWILPTFALGMRYAAETARMVRTNMLDVFSQDFVRTARAKGLGEFAVNMKHVLKNAAIPIVTLIGLQITQILGGAVITETVFALPGLGKLAVDGILSRNIPVIQGTVVYTAMLFVVINLIVDLIYGVLDPRIRIGKGAKT